MTFHLPDCLLWNKTILKFGLKLGRRYSYEVSNIPPSAVDALCDEIRRIKKIHTTWELVNVQSADGENIQIIL